MSDIENEIVSVAKKILEGALGVIEGARILKSFRVHSAFENDEDILVAVAIDSDSDSFPIGEMRKNWSPDALCIKDKEMELIQNYYRDYLFSACDRLLKRLQN